MSRYFANTCRHEQTEADEVLAPADLTDFEVGCARALALASERTFRLLCRLRPSRVCARGGSFLRTGR